MAPLRAVTPAVLMLCLALGLAPGQACAAGRDIVLPVDVAGVADRLAVEIDGTDVTDFVRVEDGQVVILASAALAPGAHVATIYVEEGDGYRIFATYRFEVPEAAGPEVTVTLEATHEVGVTSGEGGHLASSGTLTAETPDQSMVARLSYVADTREENQIAGRFADIAEYSVELRQSGALLDLVGRIGHQSLGFDPALVADLNRRGLSVEGAGPDERFQFHLFALKSSASEGAENILGLSQEEDRVFGGRLAFRPIVGSDLRLSFQGYEGRGAPDFAVISGVGSGRGVALDGSAVAGRLRYGLAWARVDWDGDGPGPLPVDEDEALLASLSFDMAMREGRALTLGLEYEEVDFFYYSLTNPGLPTGGKTVRLTADYAAERLTLYGTLETTLTNEGGDPAEPIDRSNRFALDGTWALYDAGFLSDATLSFGLSFEDFRRVETPLFADSPENWSGTTATLGLEKYGETSGWSLAYSYLREVDDGPGNFDIEGHEIFATLDLAPSDRLTLAASGLLGRYDSAFSGRYERFDGDIGLDYALEPQVWDLSLDLGWTTTTEQGLEDGKHASAALTRSFLNGGELVLHAGWYDGTAAQSVGVDEETIVGLVYRIRSDIVR